MKKDIITVKNLTKKFWNFIAVNDISFKVWEWEIFAFLWPNGAGKTTTIKMLTTLLNPNTGEVDINWSSPFTEKNNVRRSIWIVFQDPSLDDELTAYENMIFHATLYWVEKKIAKERIVELLNLVELRDRKDDLVKTFSGGMKRRLEIARWLIHHPKILFLDEPTIWLDPQTRNFLWWYITELNKKENMTIFLTTHYMEEAEKIANRIAIIDHGEIISIWSSQELKQKTETDSLEAAFLKLTWTNIRKEDASSKDNIRMRKRFWWKR